MGAKIKARRIQEKPVPGEFRDGTLAAAFKDVNNSFGLSLFQKVREAFLLGRGCYHGLIDFFSED